MELGTPNVLPSKTQLRSVKAIDLYHALTYAFEQGWVPRGWVRWDRVEALKRSIEERGLIEPIVCAMLPDGRLVPVHGVHRIMALMKLGPPTREVPVIIRPVKSDHELLEVAIEAGITTELSKEELFAMLAAKGWLVKEDVGVDSEVVEAVEGIKVDELRKWLAQAVIKRSLGEDGGVVIPFRRVVEAAKLPQDRQLALYEQLLKEAPDPSRAEPSKVKRAFEGALKALGEGPREAERGSEGPKAASTSAAPSPSEDIEVGVIAEALGLFMEEARRWMERALGGVDDERLRLDLQRAVEREREYRAQAAYWRSRYLEAEERARALEAAVRGSGISEVAGELARLKRALDDYARAVDELRADNERLRDALEASGDRLRMEVVALRTEVERLRAENEELRRLVERLMEENERLRRENEELKAKLRGES